MARVVVAAFEDGKTTTIPVLPHFKLKAPRHGTFIELTLRNGSRALLNVAHSTIVTVAENLSEEDPGA